MKTTRKKKKKWWLLNDSKQKKKKGPRKISLWRKQIDACNYWLIELADVSRLAFKPLLRLHVVSPDRTVRRLLAKVSEKRPLPGQKKIIFIWPISAFVFFFSFFFFFFAITAITIAFLPPITAFLLVSFSSYFRHFFLSTFVSTFFSSSLFFF